MKKQKINITIICAFVLGIILSLQINEQRPYATMSLKNIREIEYAKIIEQQKIEKIKIDIEEKKKELENIQNFTQEENIENLKKELEEKKLYAGYKEVEGAGIKLKIGDSKRELKENENPNNLIVHDQDIIILINSLKTNGAYALAINGERILQNTAIQCSGPTITINGNIYGQPFIISAIGNPKELSYTINSPESYGYLLKNVYNLDIEIIEESNIKIPAYKQ